MPIHTLPIPAATTTTSTGTTPSHRPLVPLEIIRPPQPRKRVVERRPQRPVLEAPHVALEHGVDKQLRAVGAPQQRVGLLVGPVQRDGRREGDEEVVEQELGGAVLARDRVAHARERQVVDPRRVRRAQLRGRRRRERREHVVVVARRADLPAHHQEHVVQDGDALGQAADARERGEDVGEDFRQRVRVGAVGRVQQRPHRRVPGPDHLPRRHPLRGPLPPLVQEVQEQAVERARRGAVPDRRRRADPGRRRRRQGPRRRVLEQEHVFLLLRSSGSSILDALPLLLLLRSWPSSSPAVYDHAIAIQRHKSGLGDGDGVPVVLHGQVLVLGRVLGAVGARLHALDALRGVQQEVELELLAAGAEVQVVEGLVPLLLLLLLAQQLHLREARARLLSLRLLPRVRCGSGRGGGARGG